MGTLEVTVVPSDKRVSSTIVLFGNLTMTGRVASAFPKATATIFPAVETGAPVQ